MVSQDCWSLVTGAIVLKCRPCIPILPGFHHQHKVQNSHHASSHQNLLGQLCSEFSLNVNFWSTKWYMCQKISGCIFVFVFIRKITGKLSHTFLHHLQMGSERYVHVYVLHLCIVNACIIYIQKYYM